MRKGIIAGVIVLALGAAVLLLVVNLNALIRRNKDYLIDQAEQALGRKLAVGEVRVSLWPGLGVRFHDFVMSDDPAFSAKEFIRASDLQVNARLLPLLRGRLQIKRLILHNPKIEIIRDEKGAFNFSSIAAEEEEKKARGEKKKRERAPTPPAFLVSLVDIEGGEIHYLDRKERADVAISDIQLKVKDLDFNQPFSVELAAAVPSGKRNLNVRARVGPLASGTSFDQVPIEGRITFDPLEFGKLKAAMPRIGSYLPAGLVLSGTLQVKDLDLKGTLNNLALNGTLEGKEAGISYGSLFQKPSGVALTLSLDSQVTKKALSFKKTNLKLHNLDLRLKGDTQLGSAPALNLSIETNRFGLEGWEKILPALSGYQFSGNLETRATIRGAVGKGAAPKINGTVSLENVSGKLAQLPKPFRELNAKVSFTGEQAQIPDASLRVGESQVRLSAQVQRLTPLALSYRLSSPELRLSDLQATEGKSDKGDLLKNLSSDGALKMQNGSLSYQGKVSSTEGSLNRINYKDLAAGISLENKILNFKNLVVKALNGSLQADGQYEFAAAPPRFSLSSKTRGLDLRELSRILQAEGGKQFQGRLNSDLKVSGRGKTWEEMKPTLTGTGVAEVLQGTLLDFNIAESVLGGVTGFPGLTSLVSPQIRKKYPAIFTAKNTEFKELKTQFTLGEGKANVKELTLTAADFAVRGTGWVDFNQRVDLQSVLSFSNRLSADIAGSAKEVRYLFNDKGNLEIPFSLKGTLPGARPKPDMSFIGRQLQRGFLRKGTEELQKRFLGPKERSRKEETEPTPEPKRRDRRPPTEELIRKGLEGLFGR
ncbi:MAG: AsmA family protein [Deltaproteobacteria bacterium]|nr:AsmA family protein [Deltaproteobacteria bacterium]